jgi:hypothetical protein
MGNKNSVPLGTQIGDFFFPSNAKFRARAAELEIDCKTFKAQFDVEKKEL